MVSSALSATRWVVWLQEDAVPLVMALTSDSLDEPFVDATIRMGVVKDYIKYGRRAPKRT